MLLKAFDKKNQVNVDLCINKVFEIYNSKMMHTYCKINPDFQKLALLLKNWNKKRFPNNQTRLNSFSIVLMLLSYMQSLGQLPNLQNFGAERRGLTDKERPTNYKVQRICAKIGKYTEISDCYFESDMQRIHSEWKIKQKVPASEVLIGFFAKYLFDYNPASDVIDISAEDGFRSFEKAKKIVENCCHSEKCKQALLRDPKWTFFILDPFDKGYNPAKAIEKDSEIEVQYFTEMAETLIQLLIKKEKKLRHILDSFSKSPEPKLQSHKSVR